MEEKYDSILGGFLMRKLVGNLIEFRATDLQQQQQQQQRKTTAITKEVSLI